MNDDLVTRRDEMQARFDALGGWDGISDMLQKAMDRIKADAATIARLEGERDELQGAQIVNRAAIRMQRAKRAAAEAQVAALVEAAQGMSTPIKNVDFETRLEQHGRLFAAIAAAKGVK